MGASGDHLLPFAMFSFVWYSSTEVYGKMAVWKSLREAYTVEPVLNQAHYIETSL